MYTAVLTVENILDDAGHDIWAVNVDPEYLEEGPAAARCDAGPATGRDAPVLPAPRSAT